MEGVEEEQTERLVEVELAKPYEMVPEYSSCSSSARPKPCKNMGIKICKLDHLKKDVK